MTALQRSSDAAWSSIDANKNTRGTHIITRHQLSTSTYMVSTSISLSHLLNGFQVILECYDSDSWLVIRERHAIASYPTRLLNGMGLYAQC